MYGQWVLDDMSSLTYIEGSRPCSPHFEYISEYQNPWLVGACPKRTWESSYLRQSSQQSLSARTTGLQEERQHQTQQTESNYLGRATNPQFGLQSAIASIWAPLPPAPPSTGQEALAPDNASPSHVVGFNVEHAHLIGLHLTMDTEIADSYLTSEAMVIDDADAEADTDYQEVEEYTATDEFYETSLVQQTTSTMHPSPSCTAESPWDLGNFSSISNLYTLFEQPFPSPNWTMGFNMRLPLARLDKYIVALRQLVRRCCEVTTIT